MKTNIRIFVAVVFLFMGTGCQDFLERDNPTATTDDKWWNLETDLRNALERVYEGVPTGVIIYNGFYSNARVHLSGASDESVFRANYTDFEVFTLGTATSSSGIPLAHYQNRYNSIRNACRFLENYQKAYVQDPSLKERYAAEARALRAWYHFELFTLFGPIAIVDHALTPAEQYVGRNSQDEVVAFIISELDKAAEVLPARYPDSDMYRMSKGVCYAIQTNLYMFIGDYKNAAVTAKKVIDLNVYELYQSADPAINSYAALFSYAGLVNKERVFFFRSGQRQAFLRLAPKSFGGANATTSPTLAIVNTYETKQGKTLQELGPDSLAIYTKNPNHNNNRDPRFTASILTPGETFLNRKMDPFSTTSIDLIGQTQSTQTGFWIKKWLDARDISNQENGSLDFFVIRYAEVLLNYVEALIETGDWQNPDVLRYLNQIRKRAGMPNVDTKVYNSQAKMREFIRRERQVELAFEGQRFYDIRRWKIGEQVLNGTVYGAVDPATGKPVAVEQRKFNPQRDYLWPIPLAEINANPKMTQNPNW
ncbi:putative outer membrane starch-binding protein [Larkinella arboricola]|uniref:Putative outer membrane starch-binding protein n=1 Tax=Larkinella arboricola TaxID=643671 RepID=A0A327X0B7_LARAB|nr:RagB/SusD family nutrient uptake outer membrane protein [Larkinella arboricola]RAJ95639.1 putative outer membrane starch-binding protein [Larkinella arboricola]